MAHVERVRLPHPLHVRCLFREAFAASFLHDPPGDRVVRRPAWGRRGQQVTVRS
ncbi:hypothetical protein [Streptosporangium saharense]|uniref:hypothetical protein n=1 Tax=Streptosporangium saharense TaxID=1706840 RepID=UPI00332D7D38